MDFTRFLVLTLIGRRGQLGFRGGTYLEGSLPGLGFPLDALVVGGWCDTQGAFQ